MSTPFAGGPDPRTRGACPACGAADGAPCTGSPVGAVHAERLRENATRPSTVPGYLDAVRAANRARRKPDQPPRSGPAVVLPARARGPHPTMRGYRPPMPQLWVYWEGRWKLALVLARYDYSDGKVAYEVEFHDHLERTRTSRRVLWGPDSVRTVDN
ncbi:hypothetical protein [Streptacidiphilus sp. MAP5-52]|uniref:hypothetical protein n=1 Tax=Streptacidiphilus sp. MAP5-52 TaxID=3156267 RepID=UPI003513F2D0